MTAFELMHFVVKFIRHFRRKFCFLNDNALLCRKRFGKPFYCGKGHKLLCSVCNRHFAPLMGLNTTFMTSDLMIACWGSWHLLGHTFQNGIFTPFAADIYNGFLNFCDLFRAERDR